MYSRFSPEFIEASLNSQFSVGVGMPCPRCGRLEVTFKNPKRYLATVPVLAVISLVLLILRQVSLGIGVGLATCVIGMTILSMEPTYVCKYCGHTWRFRDAEKWARAIRHDHAAKS